MLLILVAGLWAAGLVLVAGLCAAARRGDDEPARAVASAEAADQAASVIAARAHEPAPFAAPHSRLALHKIITIRGRATSTI